MATDPKVVTFKPDGTGYGVVDCSWEDEVFRREHPRSPITEPAARKVAEGFSAEFRVEGKW